MKLPYSRVLVTGATGFIGMHLVAALRKQRIEVHGVGLPSTEQHASSDVMYMHEGDITDHSFLQRVFDEVHPDVVFHLAAYGTFGHEKDVERMIAVNIRGTNALLEVSSASGVKAFIMAGSAKEYATGRIPISEEQALAPWDEYAVTKAAAGFFCRLAAVRHGLPTTVLRLSPVYGPGDSLSRFIPMAIAATAPGKEFTISTGSLVRNFTYIDDVIDVFLRASRRLSGGYEACNVAFSQAYSFHDILQAVEKATGKTITTIVAHSNSLTDDSWVLDASKAKRLLGWEGKTSLEEGIVRTVQWYTATHVC